MFEQAPYHYHELLEEQRQRTQTSVCYIFRGASRILKIHLAWYTLFCLGGRHFSRFLIQCAYHSIHTIQPIYFSVLAICDIKEITFIAIQLWSFMKDTGLCNYFVLELTLLYGSFCQEIFQGISLGVSAWYFVLTTTWPFSKKYQAEIPSKLSSIHIHNRK